MLAYISLGILIIFTILSGLFFGKHFQEHELTKCLIMFVAMTQSTLMGILVALWESDIVFATIISIVISFILLFTMTYKLSSKLILDSLSMTFMGAMMGTMLGLMTTNYEQISITFFTMLYIISVLLAAGMWKKSEKNIIEAIPRGFSFLATSALIILATVLFVGMIDDNSHEVESEVHSHQH